ncbi:helix-turn-helix domain-containing protein [Variovorax guangxiensis]|uniref:Transcriptional regulator with XRE-family HTH domain n=1 Tax=Variovorax guangxiensis TaxID=1775474 RepID=A0A840G2P9_9BURK|nr:helix-turn-helix transcriptional regulator [Variovorax guangxiensis]MBB4226080.1 transcriptional regulator with XRE-family HTH domain [Variovorax guangxiensis]
MKSRNEAVRDYISENSEIFVDARRLEAALAIRKKMQDKGLRVSDIAFRLGVAEANVSRWLRGNQNLSLDTLYRLADAMEEPIQIGFSNDDDNASHCEYQKGDWDSWSHNESVQQECWSWGGGQVVCLWEYKEALSRRTPAPFARAKSGYGMSVNELLKHA